MGSFSKANISVYFEQMSVSLSFAKFGKFGVKCFNISLVRTGLVSVLLSTWKFDSGVEVTAWEDGMLTA